MLKQAMNNRNDIIAKMLKRITVMMSVLLLSLGGGGVKPAYAAQSEAQSENPLNPLASGEAQSWMVDWGRNAIGDNTSKKFICSLGMTEGRLVDRVDRQWVPDIKNMALQFTVMTVWQTVTIGMFFDAEQQLKSQRLLQKLAAEAQKDYRPSVQICKFGTSIRSLARADTAAETNTHILSKIMMERELLTESSSADGGAQTDIDSRLRQFKAIYCDPKDNNGALIDICQPARAANLPSSVNKDVNYRATMVQPLTLGVNFMDGKMEVDEQDVIALGKNLFAHNLFEALPETYAKQREAKDDIVDLRSIQAMRSVIWNSFAHQVGIKARGAKETANATPGFFFVAKLLEELGMTPENAKALIGPQPSYYAQMDVLTKKIYQNPQFYTNLYDSPTNVKRTRATIKAIQLMQDRDRFEASLRREMLVSLLLEAQIREAQREVENDYYAQITRQIVEPQ